MCDDDVVFVVIGQTPGLHQDHLKPAAPSVPMSPETHSTRICHVHRYSSGHPRMYFSVIDWWWYASCSLPAVG